jgi:class 3 adenylate cyclase
MRSGARWQPEDGTEAFVERRLAAIMAADAVGYSRLMREDEPGALALLTSIAPRSSTRRSPSIVAAP